MQKVVNKYMSRINFIITISMFFICLLIYGCSQTQVATDTTITPNYFPNTQGYSWKWGNSSGLSYVVTVEGTKKLGSITAQVAKVVYMFGANVGIGEMYWRVDNAGVYYYPEGSVTDSFTALSFPLEVGKTWECISSNSLYYPTTVEILASEEVTVSGTTFDCYKVSYIAAGGITYYWFGNGVGAVKALMAGSTQEVVLEWKNF